MRSYDSRHLTTASCPICLQSIADNTSGTNGDSTKQSSANNNLVFELSSCHHKFCTACLHAYVRSKLLDGVIDVPCCHFNLSSPEEDDFRPCNVVIEQDDIYQLVHMEDVDTFENDETQQEQLTNANDCGGSCCSCSGGPDCQKGKRSDFISIGDSEDDGDDDRKGPVAKAKNENELWTRYCKLKFDAHHGKESVRRCPKCDEARLFDEESMKKYRSAHLTSPDAATGASNDQSDASAGRSAICLQRAFGVFRQNRRRDAAAAGAVPADADAAPTPSVGLDNAANPKEGNNAKEEGSNDAKGKEKESSSLSSTPATCGLTSMASPNIDDNDNLSKTESASCDLTPMDSPNGGDNVNLSKSDEPSSLSPIDDDEEACKNSQSGGSGDESTNNQESPAKSALPSPTHAPTGEAQSLVKSTDPIVTCHACDTEFCYFHSNAHAGGSCVEYHRRNLEADSANIEYARRALRARACPSCGISVSKDGGCNQIKCGSCGTHFCWLCGTIVDDGAFPEHFRWWNLRGCANMQLDENDEPLRCTIWGARALSVLQILVLGVPSLVLTLASMLLCPCLVPGCGRTNRERIVNCVSFWGSLLSSLLLLPFTCMGMVLLTALYCFLAAVTFFFKIFTSSGGQGGSSTDTSNAVAGRNGNRRGVAAGDTENATSPEFIRELESIFDRIEEGRATSNSAH